MDSLRTTLSMQDVGDADVALNDDAKLKLIAILSCVCIIIIIAIILIHITKNSIIDKEQMKCDKH